MGKRKKDRRMLEGTLEASNAVSIRTVPALTRDGRATTKKVKESLYDIPTPAPPTAPSSISVVRLETGTDAMNIDDPFVQFIEPVRRATMRQSDYIHQFVERIDDILGALLHSEALRAEHGKCQTCNTNKWAIWRCSDCILSSPKCRQCMRSAHVSNPFHRIAQWTGTYYRDASLWEVGVYLLLPHRLQQPLCDTLMWQQTYLEEHECRTDDAEQTRLQTLWVNSPRTEAPTFVPFPEEWDDGWDKQPSAEEEARADEEFEEYLQSLHDQPGTNVPEPEDEDECVDYEENATPIEPYLPEQEMPNRDIFNNTYVRVVHLNGIHHLALVSCNCHGGDSVVLDLIAEKFLPSSFKTIRTLFTAQLLDTFRLASLELKASAYQFYRLLRRHTNPIAPHKVLNLYHEFRRMSRLWRWTKKLKWAGFAGHNQKTALEVGAGELANFCPACPQIGINVADNWMQDPNRFVYRRLFVADGNFKADHVRAAKPSTDVWLSEGAGFIPKRSDYHEFLRVAMEKSTKAPCETTFRAITNSLLASKACDVTGVVGIACARHGCYAPTALCDLFKGEQQKNVDYALLSAIFGTKVDSRQGLMMLYDIICQYIIHLRERIGHRLPQHLEIEAAIGMFHVHAHKEECFFQYAPLLIPGAGRVCGEILESLWADLNVISPTIRTATLAHRAEILDDHVGDSNQKKLFGMVQFLRRQYLHAAEMKPYYNKLFLDLTSRSPSNAVLNWTTQIEGVEEARINNRSAMDIYGVNLTVTNDLPQGSAHNLSMSSAQATTVDVWINFGLVVEEKQIEIRRKLNRFGKTPKPVQQQELERLRAELTALMPELGRLQRAAGIADVGSTSSDTLPLLDWNDPDGIVEVEPEPESTRESRYARRSGNESLDVVASPIQIESVALLLPSHSATTMQYREYELHARQRQAGSQLASLRELIVNKSFQYADIIRAAPRKSVKTKGRKIVADISQDIMYHSQIYTECRIRMQRLQAGPELLNKFRELHKEDVRSSTAFINPNTIGSTRIELSWIWHSVNHRLNVFLQRDRDQPENENAETSEDRAPDEECADQNPEQNSPAMLEYKRIHWLRSRAQSLRWNEEYLLITYEMQWTVKYFESKSLWWKSTIRKAEAVGKPLTPAQKAYAERQSALWYHLMADADHSFVRINSDYVKL